MGLKNFCCFLLTIKKMRALRQPLLPMSRHSCRRDALVKDLKGHAKSRALKMLGAKNVLLSITLSQLLTKMMTLKVQSRRQMVGPRAGDSDHIKHRLHFSTKVISCVTTRSTG